MVPSLSFREQPVVVVAYALLLLLFTLPKVQCFAVQGLHPGFVQPTSRVGFLVGSSSASLADDTRAEPNAFFAWFENFHPDSFLGPDIDLVEFPASGLRGISWQGDPLQQGDDLVTIARLPRAMTLQADYTLDDWDVQLALRLCREIEDDNNSLFSGYLSSLPDRPAPHAVRKWTPAQKHELAEASPAGQRLVKAADDQAKSWKEAYVSLDLAVDWERFEWAMETVNSRAFCGLSGTGGVLWRSIGAPLLAAAGGAAVLNSDLPDNQQLVLLGILAVAAILPTIRQIARGPNNPERAYLLPFIDLINHSDSATSSRIQWDPLKQEFRMQIGPDCLVAEDEADGRIQVYINYGPKSDAEWLKNFGFLPGMDWKEVSSDDDLRRCLAEEFLRRNP